MRLMTFDDELMKHEGNNGNYKQKPQSAANGHDNLSASLSTTLSFGVSWSAPASKNAQFRKLEKAVAVSGICSGS